MSLSGACRFVSLGVAAICLLVGLGLTVTSLVTPAWQTLQSEVGQYHEHGLWMDCLKSKGDVKSRCIFKFFEDHDHEHTNVKNVSPQHQQHGWLNTTFYLLITSCICAIIALLFSFCSPCLKGCSIVWNIFCLLAFALSAIGLSIFFANSHKKEYRFIPSVRGDAEQEQLTGYSFWCAVAGCGFLLLTFLVSVLGTIVIFMHDRAQVYHHKTWPKHHNTAV